LAMYMLVVFFIVLVVIQKMGWFSSLPWEDVTMLTAGFSILVGIAAGILDITLFDSSNIIFYITPDKRDKFIKELNNHLRGEMSKVERLYNQLFTIVEGKPYKDKLEETMRNPTTFLLIKPEQFKLQEEENKRAIEMQFKHLRLQVPEHGYPPIIDQIQERGCYVSAKEIQDYKIIVNNLIKTVKDFQKTLNDVIIELELKIKPQENT
jgi:hypothetical protein